MVLKLTDWDKDLQSERDEEYQALVRTLDFTEGFGLLFVRCSPAEGEQLIIKIKENITNKNIKVLRLEQAVNNLYEIISNLDNKEEINILFITGLEHSFYAYEESKSLMGWNSRDIYSYSWKGVPPVLINLNQQRERFKDNYNICFVFLLPIFGIKYFIQRAPDFFDWRSGLFEFPIDLATLEQESSRIIQDGDYEKYIALTPEERTKEILKIQELIAEDNQISEHKNALLLNLGNLYLSGQNYKEAITCYEKTLENKLGYYQAWHNMGSALRNLGRNEEAIASYDKALEFNSYDYITWYNRGIALGNLGRYEEAIKSYDKALLIEPKHHYSWHNRGIALANLGRYEKAISSYDEALSIQPNYHYSWHNRGNALSNLGRYEEAITSYDMALSIKPNYHYSWDGRGYVLGKLERYEEAITSYDTALSIQLNYYHAWLGRGNELHNLRRYEEAIISYNKAIEFKPDFHEAWYNRGNDLSDLKRYEEAITSYEKAIEIKPDKQEAWYNRGCILGKLGRYEEAIYSYNKALEISPFDYEAWINRITTTIQFKLKLPPFDHYAWMEDRAKAMKLKFQSFTKIVTDFFINQ